jgi:hypothetical protein
MTTATKSPSSLPPWVYDLPDPELEIITAAVDRGDIPADDLGDLDESRWREQLGLPPGSDDSGESAEDSAPAHSVGEREHWLPVTDDTPKGPFLKLDAPTIHALVARSRDDLGGVEIAVYLALRHHAWRGSRDPRGLNRRPPPETGEVLCPLAEIARDHGIARKAMESTLRRLATKGLVKRPGRGRVIVLRPYLGILDAPSGERINAPSGERIGSANAPSGERINAPSGERIPQEKRVSSPEEKETDPGGDAPAGGGRPGRHKRRQGAHPPTPLSETGPDGSGGRR